MACLQNEVGTKDFFLRHEFSHEKCSESFPETIEPLFCGSKKIPQNSHQISRRISLPKIKKINDELLQNCRENFSSSGHILGTRPFQSSSHFWDTLVLCAPPLLPHPRGWSQNTQDRPLNGRLPEGPFSHRGCLPPRCGASKQPISLKGAFSLLNRQHQQKGNNKKGGGGLPGGEGGGGGEGPGGCLRGIRGGG